MQCIKILIKTHAKHACLITDSMWYTKMILICIIIITVNVIIIAFVIPGSVYYPAQQTTVIQQQPVVLPQPIEGLCPN